MFRNIRFAALKGLEKKAIFGKLVKLRYACEYLKSFTDPNFKMTNGITNN